jgi:hypothetical protein
LTLVKTTLLLASSRLKVMSPVALKPPERVAVSKTAATCSGPPGDACVLMVG